MAITIVATPGAVGANSYATVAEADAYQETHLYATPWTGATTERQKAALVWATRLLDDVLEYVGWRTSTTQTLGWPRTGVWTPDNIEVDDATIPQFMINAVSEFSRRLLETDRTAEPGTKGFSAIEVGPISLEIDKLDAQLESVPDSVFDMLIPYATFRRSSSSVRLVRT